MRRSRNLQDGGPGRQGNGNNYRTPPPPGHRSRNLHAEYNGPTLAQRREADHMRHMQEQEYRRQMRAEEEAMHRQQMQQEAEYRDRERRDAQMRQGMYGGGQRGRGGGYSGGGGGGGGGRGGPDPRFRSRNLQTGPAYMDSLREQEQIRQYRENNRRRGGRGGGGGGCSVM